MSKKQITFRIEEGEVGLLKEKFNIDNQSEDIIRLAIIQSLSTEDLESVKTLFPYLNKEEGVMEKLDRKRAVVLSD